MATTTAKNASDTTPETAADNGFPEAEKVDYVVYTGQASTRKIGKDDFLGVGSSREEDAVWNFHNNFCLPKADFDKPALVALEADGGFAVVQL